jgi:hypothetical protein
MLLQTADLKNEPTGIPALREQIEYRELTGGQEALNTWRGIP